MGIRGISMVCGTAMLALVGVAAAETNATVPSTAPTTSPSVAPTPAAAYWTWGSSGPGYGYYGYSGPIVSVPLVAVDGIYCKTSLKTCLLREPGWLGTGCSCRVPGGYTRGVVE